MGHEMGKCDPAKLVTTSMMCFVQTDGDTQLRLHVERLDVVDRSTFVGWSGWKALSSCPRVEGVVLVSQGGRRCARVPIPMASTGSSD